MLSEQIKDYDIILASKSPRRQEYFRQLRIPFDVEIRETVESYPEELKGAAIAEHIAKQKARAFADSSANSIIITADTVVWVDGKALGKPADHAEAVKMLKLLSGKKHEVITGVCFKNAERTRLFSITTEVFFKPLSNEEIEHYIKEYKPFDKAGSYGIQEWIGHIGITHIHGSYSNVVGLPVAQMADELLEFIDELS